MSDRIDIAGWAVREVCIGLRAVLIVGPVADAATQAKIVATGVLSIEAGGGRTELDVEGSHLDLAPLLGLYGAVVAECVVDDDSMLVLRFEDGPVVEIPPDPEYEAWEVWEPGGTWIAKIREPQPR